MEKYWTIEDKCRKFKTYKEAEDAAKRAMAQHRWEDCVIFEAIAVVKSPVPEFEVTKL